jgi:O-succinylbenzoic acid--CoA ligase
MAYYWGYPWRSPEMAFLNNALSEYPSGLALEDDSGKLTYSEMVSLAAEMARKLRASAIGPGSVVALEGGMGRNNIMNLHAIWMAGASVAPLSQRWTQSERETALELLSPTHLMEEWALPAGGTPVPDPLPGLPDGAEAARLLTSGTSGRPRVVRVGAGNLRANALASRERLGLAPSDRWLASLSLAHVGGLALVARAGLLGSGLILNGAFSAQGFIELAERADVTHASLVPTMLHQVLEAWGDRDPPGALRCLLIGGASAPQGLVESAISAGFPVALTYGLTEASSQVATAPPALVAEKPGSVGPPLPGIQLRIGDGGEILVRGPTVALGEGGPDGWLNTGDLGRLDPDGHLWVLGRQSDRIISGGVNVDPAEVEQLLQSHPAVLDAVVAGVLDEEWGERVVAGVVTSGSQPSLEEELHRLARWTLSPAKRPREILLLKAVPRNPNGKVDRERFRALFQ